MYSGHMIKNTQEKCDLRILPAEEVESVIVSLFVKVGRQEDIKKKKSKFYIKHDTVERRYTSCAFWPRKRES